MFRTVLVPLDGTYLAERALPYAVRLAYACGAELVLYHWTPPLAMECHPADERAASLELEAAAARARARGVPAETIIDHTAHDDAAAAVVDSAEARGADFIVMASHGRRGVADAVLGSDAERVIRNAGMPVLVVPAKYDQPRSADPDVRIVVGLDGSFVSEAALEPAAALARGLRGRLLARAVDPGRPTTGRAVTEARAYVDQVRARLARSRLRVEGRVEVGPHRRRSWRRPAPGRPT